MLQMSMRCGVATNYECFTQAYHIKQKRVGIIIYAQFYYEMADL